MNIQSLKKDILHKIIEIDREDILIKISNILKIEKKDFWDELSENQKNEVELGLKQIDSGETEDWDDFLKRVS